MEGLPPGHGSKKIGRAVWNEVTTPPDMSKLQDMLSQTANWNQPPEGASNYLDAISRVGGMAVPGRGGIDDIMRALNGPPPGTNPFAIGEILNNMSETLKVPVRKLGTMIGRATLRRVPNPQSPMRAKRVTENMVEDLPDIEGALGINLPKTLREWVDQEEGAFRMSEDMASELVRMGRN